RQIHRMHRCFPGEVLQFRLLDEQLGRVPEGPAGSDGGQPDPRSDVRVHLCARPAGLPDLLDSVPAQGEDATAGEMGSTHAPEYHGAGALHRRRLRAGLVSADSHLSTGIDPARLDARPAAQASPGAHPGYGTAALSDPAPRALDTAE